ncbi:MAG: ABC transporter substrate-binding protein [archaeon]
MGENKMKLIVGLIAFVLIFSIGAIAYQNTALFAQVTSDETISIGWIGPLTGPSAVLGMDSITAAEIAVKEINSGGGINGKKLKLITEDDQYVSTKTISAYQKITQIDGAKIVLVNTYSGIFALAKQAQKDGVILIDPLDCSSLISALNENVFCLATDSESIANVLSSEAKKQGNSAGIIYFIGDQFMPQIKEWVSQKFSGKIVSESYSPGVLDFKTIIEKMKFEKVDSLILLGYDETGVAMRQARELGFSGQFITTATITSPSLVEASKGAANGTIFAFWSADANRAETKEFNKSFLEEKQRLPILDLATYPTYDTVKAIAKALGVVKNKNVLEIRTALLGVNFWGTTGEVNFNQTRASKIPEQAYRLENGKVVAKN